MYVLVSVVSTRSSPWGNLEIGQLHLKVARFGHHGQNNSTTVRKPYWFVVDAIARDCQSLFLSGRNVHGKEAAERVVCGLNKWDHDGLAVRGPCGHGAVGGQGLVAEDGTLFRTVAAGNPANRRRRIVPLAQNRRSAARRAKT